MTLEEAIAHCLEVAEENEKQGIALNEMNFENSCKECASEHRQLAECLQELKIYREHTYAEMMQDEEVNADDNNVT